MNISRAHSWLIGTICAAVACILQAVGLARYVGRLPHDWVGIGLYSITLVAFAVAAFGFYVQWKRERKG
jgi:hypothetical protein